MGMNILALETSQAHASLALSANGVISVQESWVAERNHDAYLFPALRKALETLGNEKLNLILVGAGPGSYGGVRVSLAAATGIAQVSGASVAAVCSWNQLAESGAAVVSDARRNSWTVRKDNGCIEVLTDEALLALQRNGIRLLSTEAPGVLQKRGIVPDKENLTPTAEGLIRTWEGLTETDRKTALNTPPEPIYVRPPHITKQLHKPWELRH